MPATPRESYFIGVDLGQMADYTAVTVVQRLETRTERPAVTPPSSFMGGSAYNRQPDLVTPTGYHLRHLERLPLGTSYTAVAARVKALQDSGPLAGANTTVVADTTGVGLPVFEMMRSAGVRSLFGVTIHSGDAVARDGRIYRVPKRDLVSTVQVLLQKGTLKFAEGLPEGPVLRHELQNFKAKINLTTGHDSYEAWREGDHDDLVLSLAMACWLGENLPTSPDWSTAPAAPQSRITSSLRY